MVDPGRLLDLIAPLIILLGPGLMAVGLFRLSRAGRMQRDYPAPMWDRSGRQRLRRGVQATEPIPAEQIPALQFTARAQLAQRGWLLVALGASWIQFVDVLLLADTGPIRLSIGAVVVVFMAVMSVIVEQQARLGTAFLQRYPLPESPRTS